MGIGMVPPPMVGTGLPGFPPMGVPGMPGMPMIPGMMPPLGMGGAPGLLGDMPGGLPNLAQLNNMAQQQPQGMMDTNQLQEKDDDESKKKEGK